jgi:hypothetical protein
MRFVPCGWSLALALAVAANATSAPTQPGPFSTPFANPETPTITLRVGQSATFGQDGWRANQRVTCAGNHEALDGDIPGMLGVAPLYAQVLRVDRPLVLRVNHGLELSLVATADHSITVTCSRHG